MCVCGGVGWGGMLVSHDRDPGPSVGVVLQGRAEIDAGRAFWAEGEQLYQPDAVVDAHPGGW